MTEKNRRKCMRYLHYFTRDELKNGAMDYFTGDLNVEFKTSPHIRFGLCGADTPSTEKQIEIKGKYECSGNFGVSWKECRMLYDTDRSEIIYTDCPCEDFQKDYFGCRHLAGALSGYLAQAYGNDFLEGSIVENLLKEASGEEKPLLPDILRRTDAQLAVLMQNTEQQELPMWVCENGGNEILSAEFSVHSRSWGEMEVEIKAGSKRKYVVRDFKTFMEAYIGEKEYYLGKNVYVLRHAQFDADSARILDFLAETMLANLHNEQIVYVFTSGNMQAGTNRYMILAERDLDAFMEAVEGMDITAGRTVRVDLGYEGIRMELSHSGYGMTMKMNQVNRVAYSTRYDYMTADGKLFRMRRNPDDKLFRLTRLMNQKKELYVKESEIASVCREFLPLVRQSGSVEAKGLDLVKYEEEDPVFELYLDLPQADMVSCQPYAVYPRAGKKYLLFGGERVNALRSPSGERKAAQVLGAMFQAFDQNQSMLFLQCDEMGLYEFVKKGIPHLSSLGQVYISDALKKLKIRSLPAVSVGVAVETGRLTMSLTSASMPSWELAEILSAYSRKKRFTRLKNGSFISFEEDDGQSWQVLAEMFRNSGKKDPEAMKLPLYRAMYLDEMLKKRDDIQVNGNEGYRQLLKRMETAQQNEYKIPASLEKVLRAYQKEGFNWILTLKNCGFGGILADDMGLGKTLQVLAFLQHEKEAGKSGDELRTLIIAPASLVYNWQREIERFTPELSCLVLSGTAGLRKEMLSDNANADIWITSYDLLKRDIGLYEEIVFANEIIDEAQYIKNHNTKAAQTVRVINSSFRLALTGTPIENKLSELWSIFDYLMPGFLYTYTRFRGELEEPIVSGKEEDAMERLRGMVHPFILRRLKRDVLKELPEKMEEVVTVRLEGEQRRLYDAHAQRLAMYLDKQSPEEFRNNKLEILAELTRLRQLCCDPELIYEGYHKENAKLEACLQLIRQAMEGGHKLLLFSQFTSMLDVICARLKKEKIAYHRIDGSVSKEDRMKQVEAFASDDVRVFCISLKAGGTGLNLTAADIVIHYDPWWNQAAQNQATDRAHRIGQTQTVNVYELIARDTIEERIQELKNSKTELMEEVLSGEGIRNTLINREELLRILR